MNATDARITFQDTPTTWTDKSRKLLVHPGDIVIDAGNVEIIAEIHWNPARDLYVRVGYVSGGALRSKNPRDAVTVRRYFTEET